MEYKTTFVSFYSEYFVSLLQTHSSELQVSMAAIPEESATLSEVFSIFECRIQDTVLRFMLCVASGCIHSTEVLETGQPFL